MKIMKNYISLLCLALIVLAPSCKDNNNGNSPCLPSGFGKNVIAFYSFANGSLKDVSGNNRDLTNTSSAKPTSDRDGNANCAYLFDNSSNVEEFLITTNTKFLNKLNEFSISLWYQPVDTTRSGGLFETLISRGSQGGCPDRSGQWSIGLFDCRKAVFGRTHSVWDRNITKGSCEEEVVTRTNVWSHVVATYKQSGVEMKIYRNGILQETSNGDANCISGTPGYQDIGDLFLGKKYSGKIDDVIIFNKTLSDAEVKTLFNSGTCCEK